MLQRDLPALPGLLSPADIRATALSIAAAQERCGAIPWFAGGHVRIYKGDDLEDRLRDVGLQPRGSHHAHALHAPYWWLNCMFGKESVPSRLYHQVLVWDILKRPWVTRTAEQALNPVLGKSLVVYAEAPAAQGAASAAA